MSGAIPWLWLPCVAAIGWYAARRDEEFAVGACRTASLLAGVLLTVEVVTGVGRNLPGAEMLHRWGAPMLVMILWQAAPFSAGVVLRREFPGRPGRSLLKCVFLCGVFGVTWLAALAGYLGPSNYDSPGEETRSRFLVLHCCVLPVLAMLGHGGWWWMFREPKAIATVEEKVRQR